MHQGQPFPKQPLDVGFLNLLVDYPFLRQQLCRRNALKTCFNVEAVDAFRTPGSAITTAIVSYIEIENEHLFIFQAKTLTMKRGARRRRSMNVPRPSSDVKLGPGLSAFAHPAILLCTQSMPLLSSPIFAFQTVRFDSIV